jgi:hypothetical protein
MEQELITPERAYLEAVRVAGTAGNSIPDHFGKIEQIADSIYRGSHEFSQKIRSVVRSIDLVGVVRSVEENPVSEAGRALNFYKVTFQADSGQRPDHMWLDKTKPGDVALFEVARSLVGHRAHIIKESRVKFYNGEPEMDAGKQKERPYLGFIEPLGEDEAPAEGSEANEGAPTPAKASATTKAAPPKAGPKGKATLGELTAKQPSSYEVLYELCETHLGLTKDQVNESAKKVLGVPTEGQRRRKADFVKVWNVLCHAHFEATQAA